jgi:hypothetical protein
MKLSATETAFTTVAAPAWGARLLVCALLSVAL